MKIDEVTREAFEPYLDGTFRVSAGKDLAFDAQLIEVSPVGETRGPTGRQAFSVVLRGPENDAPEQAIYQVAHEELGSIELFLVPIGPDDKGMKYEAVFT